MRDLRLRLQEAWRQPGLQSYVVERDYLLSWILAGISAVPELRETLVFKGGTALKKCYFGDYRFSEDLDFSGLEGVPKGDAISDAIDQACNRACGLLEEYAQVELHCERYVESRPHPGGQEAFRIRARLPWHPRPDISIKVEVTTDEQILWPVECCRVVHDYGEPRWKRNCRFIPQPRWLRATRQQVVRLESKGWSRNRARGLLRPLAGFSGITGTDWTWLRVDFFDPRIVDDVEKGWENSLGPLLVDLPDFTTVMGELRPQVAALLGSEG